MKILKMQIQEINGTFQRTLECGELPRGEAVNRGYHRKQAHLDSQEQYNHTGSKRFALDVE